MPRTRKPMTTEAAFWSAVKRTRKDPGPLLMFADWLTERGQGGDIELALALRWMARWGRRPGPGGMMTWFWAGTSADTWTDPVFQTYLPEAVHVLLDSHETYTGFAHCHSYEDAVRDLAKALARGREIFGVTC